jgi:hypothetical protein
MKYLLLIAAFTFMLPANEKLVKQANQAISKADYAKAAATLEKVTAEGKSELPYLQAAALVYDSLKQFKAAMVAYEQLLANDADNKSAVSQRINYLQGELAKSDAAEALRIEKMKNCGKCSGTGYYETIVLCGKCEGAGRVLKDCPRCYGAGRIDCSNCGGNGKSETQRPDGQIITIGCQRCNGEGHFKCTANCNRGKVQEDCRKCQTTGQVKATKKCDLHD